MLGKRGSERQNERINFSSLHHTTLFTAHVTTCYLSHFHHYVCSCIMKTVNITSEQSYFAHNVLKFNSSGHHGVWETQNNKLKKREIKIPNLPSHTRAIQKVLRQILKKKYIYEIYKIIFLHSFHPIHNKRCFHRKEKCRKII